MSADRFARAASLFLSACNLSEPERRAYVERECGNDLELRREVEALLAGNAQSPATARLAGDLAVQAGRALAGGAAGDIIGSYTLVSKLGEGGFGDVWLAERSRPFKQLVALKIVKPGMDSRAVVARFEQERQTLAVMEHPHIARVIDGGVTDAGRPYFVMEYVKGEPITVFAAAHRLSVRQRLELILPVCEAVQHAHRKGIIHRDLKPSNVLVEVVDGQATPKVIDFGIAKAIDHAGRAQTLLTEQGLLVGTPEYMSPEQAEGLADIDTRTDVYSLGVVLYELLVGAPPFDGQELRSKGYEEILRVIREVEPLRPSTRALATIDRSAPGLAREISRELAKELEWIPLKAMRKDRDRRYSSPESLAADIRRYLAGEALEAGPESRVYRARKFVRRHRVLLTSAALSAAALLAAAGVSLVLLDRTSTAERQARSSLAVERRRTYSAGLAAAESSLRLGDVDSARRRLESCPADLRQWEWNLLKSRAEQWAKVLRPARSPADQASVTDIAFDAKHSSVMVLDSDGQVTAVGLGDGATSSYQLQASSHDLLEDGSSLLALEKDHVRVLDSRTGKLVTTLRIPDAATVILSGDCAVLNCVKEFGNHTLHVYRKSDWMHLGTWTMLPGYSLEQVCADELNDRCVVVATRRESEHESAADVFSWKLSSGELVARRDGVGLNKSSPLVQVSASSYAFATSGGGIQLFNPGDLSLGELLSPQQVGDSRDAIMRACTERGFLIMHEFMNGTVSRWNIGERRMMSTLAVPKALAGTRVVTSSDNGKYLCHSLPPMTTYRVVQCDQPQFMKDVDTPEGSANVATPIGSRPALVTEGADGAVYLWDLRLFDYASVVNETFGSCEGSLCVDSNGQIHVLMYAGNPAGVSAEYQLLTIEPTSMHVVSRKRIVTQDSKVPVAVSPSGAMMVLPLGGSISVLAATSGEIVAKLSPLDAQDPITSMAWSEDESWLAACFESRRVCVWSGKTWDKVIDIAESTDRADIQGMPSGVLTWLPGHQCFAIPHDAAGLSLLDPRKGGTRETVLQDVGRIRDATAAVHDPANHVVACMNETEIVVVDSLDWRIVSRWPRGASYIDDMVMSPDGRRLLTVSRASMTVWDTSTGDELLTFGVGNDKADHVAWSSDGTFVVSAGFNGIIRKWDAVPHAARLVESGSSVDPTTWDWEPTRTVPSVNLP